MTDQLHFHFSLSCTGEGNGSPLQYSCLENPRDGRGWWAAVYGVAQSRTRLKRLSSSSSNPFLLFLAGVVNACWQMGFRGDSDGKESACNGRDLGSIPGLGRFPWRREWLPTPYSGLEKSTEEPGRLQCMGLQGVRRGLSDFHFQMHV